MAGHTLIVNDRKVHLRAFGHRHTERTATTRPLRVSLMRSVRVRREVSPMR